MSDDGRPSFKRKTDSGLPAARKTPKLSATATPSSMSGKKMSFAQKMMAKMGHVQGQGLGKGGEGIINPIEVKLRPMGAGVGAVKEKTEQYKQEQRRAAEARGEEYEDSSDEERKARKRRKEIAQNARKSAAAGADPAAPTRRKIKFKTIDEVNAAAPGLHVPTTMLGSIVDATGSATRLLTSAAGLMSGGPVTAESELDKIKRRERLELEAFIEAWHGLQERKIGVEEHAGHQQMQLNQQDEQIEKLQVLIDAVAGLAVRVDGEDWNGIIARLETLQEDHRHEIESAGLSDAAVATIHEPFKQAMDDWEPLAQPDLLVDKLQRIRRLLGMRSETDVAADGLYGRNHRRRAKTTTSWESLIYTLWLPKIRTTVTNWDVYDPQSLIAVIQAWRPLLPDFVMANLMDQLIVQKLSMHLQSWNPKRYRKKKDELRARLPHVWLFPWFPLLPSYHLEAKSSTGLLREVKRKFRSMLDSWDMGSGLMPGINEWQSLLGPELEQVLIRHLLPRLATHLAINFDVDPADQDLTALEQAMTWQEVLKPEIMARLLVAEFFPKWLSVLHIWLSSPEANFEEVGQWLTWWKTQIPDAIGSLPDVKADWDKGYALINAALDMQDEGHDLTQLAPPVMGSTGSLAQGSQPAVAPKPTEAPKMQIEETTFKDVVEDWCAQNDLTLVPLREPHAGTGLPLFRLSASATGRGGVLVYLKGDVIWAQKKGQKGTFEPVGLEEPLLMRAEGR